MLQHIFVKICQNNKWDMFAYFTVMSGKSPIFREREAIHYFFFFLLLLLFPWRNNP
jgi:hypothetical protein